jgi:hypothetical protein
MGRLHRLTGTRTVPGGDRLAQPFATRGGRVMRIAGAQALDGALDHRRRRVEIRIPDAQQDHVFAAFLRGARCVVNHPRIRSIPRDSLHQRRILHFFSCVAYGSAQS